MISYSYLRCTYPVVSRTFANFNCTTCVSLPVIHLRPVTFTRPLLTQDKNCMESPEAKRKHRENMPLAKIGTHNGTFHCDEVLACFFLRQLPEYKVGRKWQILSVHVLFIS